MTASRLAGTDMSLPVAEPSDDVGVMPSCVDVAGAAVIAVRKGSDRVAQGVLVGEGAGEQVGGGADLEDRGAPTDSGSIEWKLQAR
jgi:hypothetical protein